MNIAEQDIDYLRQKLLAALAIPEEFLKPQGSALSVEIQARLTEHAADQWFLEWLEAYRQAGVERTAKGFALLNEANKIYQQTRLKLDMDEDE